MEHLYPNYYAETRRERERPSTTSSYVRPKTTSKARPSSRRRRCPTPAALKPPPIRLQPVKKPMPKKKTTRATLSRSISSREIPLASEGMRKSVSELTLTTCRYRERMHTQMYCRKGPILGHEILQQRSATPPGLHGTHGYVNQTQHLLQQTVEQPVVIDNAKDQLFLTSIDPSRDDTVKEMANGIVEGMADLSNREFKRAIKKLNGVLLEALDIEDHAIAALMYHHIGNAFKELSDFKYSLKLQMECVKHARKANDRKLQGRGYKGIGVAYMALDQPKVALNHAMNALTIAQMENDVDLETRCHANLGNLYRMEKNYDKALEHHEKDLALSIEYDSWTGQERAHHNLSLVFELLKMHAKSRQHAIASQEHSNSAKRDAQVHGTNLYFHLSQPDKVLADQLVSKKVA